MLERERHLTEGAVRANARARLFSVLRKAWKRRSAEGLSAKDLANLVGRDKAQVSRVLNGRSPTITVETLALFLDRLDHQLVVDCRAAEDIPRSNVDARPGILDAAPQKAIIVAAQNAVPSIGVSWASR